MTEAKDIMRHQKFTLSPQESLIQAAEKMKEHEVGVIVVAESDKIVGIITDRDIVIRCLAKGKDPKSTRVEEAMSSPVVHCIENDSTDNIAKRMAAERLHRLPVLDHHLKLCGLVSVGNLCVVDNAKGGEVIAKISQS